MVGYKRMNRVEGKKKKKERKRKKKIPFHLCSYEPKTRRSLFGKKLMKIMEREMTFHPLISLKEA